MLEVFFRMDFNGFVSRGGGENRPSLDIIVRFSSIFSGFWGFLTDFLAFPVRDFFFFAVFPAFRSELSAKTMLWDCFTASSGGSEVMASGSV